MAVKRITVHCVDIEDKPGSLQRFLLQSALSGVDYLCFIACSCGENRGRVAVSAKDEGKFEAFAREAKLSVTKEAGFIVDGEDRAGAGADVIKGLAEREIRGIAGTGMVIKGKFRILVVVDAKDGDAAAKALGA